MSSPNETPAPAPAVASAAPRPRNRFGLDEWAGAFGDLGTLIPFVLAYLAVVGLDPVGVLLPFGVALIVTGARFKTPIPVQPMKAVGAVAATHAAHGAALTAGAVYSASLFTGLFWLVLGLTGAAERISRWIPRPVVIGVVLGLGFALMLDGLQRMGGDWVLAVVGLAVALLALANRYVPAMFLLLAGGVAVALVRDPALVRELANLGFDPQVPRFALAELTWRDAWVGLVLLALPQLPLTFGNAIVAVTEENNRLFPDRRIGERTVAISTGGMNLLGSAVGGVPMCHGAGGLAGHVRFGARTGGATIILGALLVVVALCFAPSVKTLLAIFPAAVLGVILFLAGAQIALGSCDFSRDKAERFATLVTAALAIVHVGLAFVLGIVLLALLKRGYVKL